MNIKVQDQKNQVFSWEELEREQLKIKKRGKFKNLDPKFLGYTEEQIQMYNNTFDKIKLRPIKNEIIRGKIIAINNKTAVLDIGYRENAYLDLNKENPNYTHDINIGNELNVKITSIDKGYISVSYSQAIYKNKYKQIYDSIGKKIGYYGKVNKLIPGGYIVLIDEIETFMPGSLAGLNKLYDFESLLDKTLIVMPVNFERGYIVVSHREYLHTLIPDAIKNLKENYNKTKIKGFVTGTTDFGVFCEFNECLTGLIQLSDLDEQTKILFENNSIKPGQDIEFYVKEIISDKKIILTQILKEDPWDKIEQKYKVSSIVKGKITSVKDYGVFVEIEPGIVGLINRNDFENQKIKENSIINVKINRIDAINKKIYLSAI